MSNMSTLYTLIQERLERGEEPVDIAYALDVPMAWIYEAMGQSEENSPYATINS